MDRWLICSHIDDYLIISVSNAMSLETEITLIFDFIFNLNIVR